MKKNLSNRLAILRHEIGITQRQLAQRAELSLPYIKKLEQGKKPMSKRPAVALAIATGVDWQWLVGKGKSLPIAARLGMTESQIDSAQMAGKQNPFSPALRTVLKKKGLLEQELEHAKKAKPFSREMRDSLAAVKPWKKEMADAIQNRKTTVKPDADEKMEQKIQQNHFRVIVLRCGQIMRAAIKAKRPELAFARIENFLIELAAEPWLGLKPAKPRR
ncbi:MAG TPA: helix-turn-helix transcriptional regulator [Verrucomicrobiae bacterium]